MTIDLPDLDTADGPLEFLIGVICNQTVRAESAWRAAAGLRARLGHLDAGRLAAMRDAELAAVIGRPAALHPFAASMARYIAGTCRVLVDEHDGRAAALWDGAPAATSLTARFRALPGIGAHKAEVALFLLACRYGVPVRQDRPLDSALSHCPRLTMLFASPQPSLGRTRHAPAAGRLRRRPAALHHQRRPDHPGPRLRHGRAAERDLPAHPQLQLQVRVLLRAARHPDQAAGGGPGDDRQARRDAPDHLLRRRAHGLQALLGLPGARPGQIRAHRAVHQRLHDHPRRRREAQGSRPLRRHHRRRPPPAAQRHPRPVRQGHPRPVPRSRGEHPAVGHLRLPGPQQEGHQLHRPHRRHLRRAEGQDPHHHPQGHEQEPVRGLHHRRGTRPAPRLPPGREGAQRLDPPYHHRRLDAHRPGPRDPHRARRPRGRLPRLDPAGLPGAVRPRPDAREQVLHLLPCPWSKGNPRDTHRCADHVRAAIREETITAAISGFLDQFVLGHDRDAMLAAHLPATAAAESARREAQAAELTRKIARNEASAQGLITELAQLGADTSPAAAEYRKRIRAHHAELFNANEALQAKLDELRAQAAGASDAALITELPYAAGILNQAPDDIREALYAALDIHATYRADKNQATIRATITDATPGIVAALLADPRTGADSPGKTPPRMARRTPLPPGQVPTRQTSPPIRLMSRTPFR